MPLSSGANIVFKMTGDKELRNTLKILSVQMQDAICKKAIKKGMKVIERAEKKASRKFPVVSQSIGSTVSKSRTTKQVTAKVGVNVGKKPAGRINKKTGKTVRGSAQEPVAHLFVLGTQPRYTGSTTRAAGRRGKKTATGNARHYRGVMKSNKTLLSTAAKGAWGEAKAAIAEVCRSEIASKVIFVPRS